MEQKKHKINLDSILYGRTDQKNIRLPIRMIEEVEKVIATNGWSFTEFIIESVRAGLEDVKKQWEEDEQK